MNNETESPAVLEDTLPDADNLDTLADAEGQAAESAEIVEDALAIADIPDVEERVKPDIGTMGIHPLCAIYPEMTQDEKDRLLMDVLECKKIEETIIIFEGQILDGRHRRWAILEAFDRGVDVAFTTRVFDPLTEGDPKDFVARKNGIRRMMDKGQEAVIGLKFRDRMIEEAKGGKKSKKLGDEQLGGIMKRTLALVGCGERYIRMASELRDVDPAAVEEVYSGKTTLTKAHKAAKSQQTKANVAPGATNGGTVGDAVDWETSHVAWACDDMYYIGITEKAEMNGGTTYIIGVGLATEAGDVDTVHMFDSFDVTSNLKEAKRKGVEACAAHAEKVNAG